MRWLIMLLTVGMLSYRPVTAGLSASAVLIEAHMILPYMRTRLVHLLWYGSGWMSLSVMKNGLLSWTRKNSVHSSKRMARLSKPQCKPFHKRNEKHLPRTSNQMAISSLMWKGSRMEKLRFRRILSLHLSAEQEFKIRGSTPRTSLSRHLVLEEFYMPYWSKITGLELMPMSKQRPGV